MPLLVRLFIVISAVLVLFATAVASLLLLPRSWKRSVVYIPMLLWLPFAAFAFARDDGFEEVVAVCAIALFSLLAVVEHRSPGLLRRCRAPTANERLAELRLRLRRRAEVESALQHGATDPRDQTRP